MKRPQGNLSRSSCRIRQGRQTKQNTDACQKKELPEKYADGIVDTDKQTHPHICMAQPPDPESEPENFSCHLIEFRKLQKENGRREQKRSGKSRSRTCPVRLSD